MKVLHRFAFLAAAWVAVPSLCLAQAKTGIADKNAVVDDDAITKAIGGNIDAAVDVLASRGSAARGSLFSYQQAAIALIQRAYICQAQLDYAGTAKATEAAISILTRGLEVKGKEARAGANAQAYVLLGQVYQELAGSNALARNCYQAAVIADPTNQDSKAALARLDADDAKLSKFGKGRK